MKDQIKVLVVDDDLEFASVLANELEKTGFTTNYLTEGRNLLAHLKSNPCDVILLDIQMPGTDGLKLLPKLQASFPSIQVIMLTGFGTIESAVQAVKNGAFDYLTKPSDLTRIETVIRKAHRMSQLEMQNRLLKQSLAHSAGSSELIGDSPAISEVKSFISRVARTDSSILLLGESGVGKEVVARAIQRASNRSSQPFVVVDCGALQEYLLASELFGHERGAYTGAVNLKHGLFEVANGGTLFLDEIGEINQSIQVQLLRVLETGSFRRVGGNLDITVDVRIIASTNRDLRKEATEGRFREDLFYRLNVIVATIPPLRERREDIPLLVNHFMGFLKDAEGQLKSLSAQALKSLCEYDWRGNVRELINILERLVILTPSEEIELTDLPIEISLQHNEFKPDSPDDLMTLKELERSHIKRALVVTGGNRQETASILGIDPKTLYRKLKDHPE